MTDFRCCRAAPNQQDVRVTRTGWVLFAAMSVIWGVPYFFIRVAVEEMEPSVVVFGRTVIARGRAARAGAAHRCDPPSSRALEARPRVRDPGDGDSVDPAHVGRATHRVGADRAHRVVRADRRRDPPYLLGDKTALGVIRIVGIAVGLGGVALLVGKDLSGDEAPPVWSVIALLVVCVCYATAPFIVSRRLGGVPSLGVIGLSLGAVAVIYAPIAVFSWPSTRPPSDALLSVLALGLVCTRSRSSSSSGSSTRSARRGRC